MRFNHLKTLFLVGFAWILPHPLLAQSPLSFVIENETFIKNIEREKIRSIETSHDLDGQTFIGDIIKPYFSYSVNDRVKINLGAVVDIEFGDDDDVAEADPLISLTWDFRPGWRMTAGTLDRDHPLLDAYFDDTLTYEAPVEQGFQLQAETEHLRQDAWLAWEIEELSDRQEKLSIGDYTQFRYRGFTLDGQVYWVHFGGQRNSVVGLDNNIGYAFGAGYSTQLDKTGPLEAAGLTAHYLGVWDDTPGRPGSREEDGILARAFARIWGTDIWFKYWEGGSADFDASKGDHLYVTDRFRELGIERQWKLAERIGLTANIQLQHVLQYHNDLFLEFLVSVHWLIDFPLAPDYFAKWRPFGGTPDEQP